MPKILKKPMENCKAQFPKLNVLVGDRSKIVGCGGGKAPRLTIVGNSDTLSVNLDQFLVRLT